ncbi:hypothetical protein EIP91_007611 [Steccherinum ochraceum]|uniref:Uncharacterized protein n=1 Tax=Steccherinum ochraceum TaxID=92696 RepID=A0A4R0R6E7_9APHY|nr:hypothetical protein EIP91_007611 [Steccherinum ochraceum]
MRGSVALDCRSTSSPLSSTPEHSLNEYNATIAKPTASRIPLTGFRLLNFGLIIGIGTAKAILAAQGHSTAPSVLEWVLGVICATGLYWLGLWESVEPPVLHWLLHEDYTPEVLLLARFPISAVKGVVLPVGSLLLTVVPLWLVFNPATDVPTNWPVLRFFDVILNSAMVSTFNWSYTDDCLLVSLGRIVLSLSKRSGLRVSTRLKSLALQAIETVLPPDRFTSVTPFSVTLLIDYLAVFVVGISAVASLHMAMRHWPLFGMMELCAGSALTAFMLYTLSDKRRFTKRLGDWFLLLILLFHGIVVMISSL